MKQLFGTGLFGTRLYWTGEFRGPDTVPQPNRFQELYPRLLPPEFDWWRQGQQKLLQTLYPTVTHSQRIDLASPLDFHWWRYQQRAVQSLYIPPAHNQRMDPLPVLDFSWWEDYQQLAHLILPVPPEFDIIWSGRSNTSLQWTGPTNITLSWQGVTSTELVWTGEDPDDSV